MVRYYHPDEFRELKAAALEMGFVHVESGPLVRSSYHAHETADAYQRRGWRLNRPRRKSSAADRHRAHFRRDPFGQTDAIVGFRPTILSIAVTDGHPTTIFDFPQEIRTDRRRCPAWSASCYWRRCAQRSVNTLVATRKPSASSLERGTTMEFEAIVRRVQCEFVEMPGLQLTPAQATRLWGLERDACQAVINALIASAFLRGRRPARSRERAPERAT